MKKLNITLILWILVFLFSVLLFIFFKNRLDSNGNKLETFVMEKTSYKKGVGGPATKETLAQLNVNWFYNWGTNPGYKSDSGLDNWDADIWDKFIPLFYGSSYGSISAKMDKICTNTDYCNGGYYLIGNEPLIGGQDYVSSCGGDSRADSAEACMAKIFVERVGKIALGIKEKDPNAKLIIVGLSHPYKLAFMHKFISEWKTRWKESDIVDLPSVIKGWHMHTYSNPNECPTNANIIGVFKNDVDNYMKSVFGKTVIDQEIWVTEMGSLDAPNPNGNKADYDKFKNRMKCLTNAYENSSIVTRYAWFYHGCNPSIVAYTGCTKVQWAAYNLFWPDGNPYAISDLGKLYASLPDKIAPWPVVTTPIPTLRPTAIPTPTVRPTPIPTPTPSPTVKPTPTVRPTLIPTPSPTVKPTPTVRPTLIPTPSPTAIPTPTVRPTLIPTPTLRPITDNCGCKKINENNGLSYFECKGNDNKSYNFWFEYNGEKISSDIRVEVNQVWRFSKPEIDGLEVMCQNN